MLDVDDSHLATIREILRKYLPECDVRAFGSRVDGTAKKYSDLDIVVVGEGKIPRQKMIMLKEAFEASALPFRIDLMDWHRVSPNFKKIIQKSVIVIQPASR